MSTATDGTPEDPYLEMLEVEDPYPLLHALRREDPVHFVAPLGCMIDSLLDILPPGAEVDDAAMEFLDAGLFKRPLNLPVRIPAA